MKAPAIKANVVERIYRISVTTPDGTVKSVDVLASSIRDALSKATGETSKNLWE